MFLLAFSSQDLFSCCEKGDRMTNWLERHVFQGNFPHPAAVTECRGEEDKAKALAKCQVRRTYKQPCEVLPLTRPTFSVSSSWRIKVYTM